MVAGLGVPIFRVFTVSRTVRRHNHVKMFLHYAYTVSHHGVLL